MLLAVAWPISFDRPEWLWLLLTIPVIVMVSLRWLTGIERRRRQIAVTLRSIVMTLLALALARIECVKRNDNLAVLFVLDRSRSIPEPQRLAAREYVRQTIKHAERDDRIGIVGFDGEVDVDLMPSRGENGLEMLGFSMADEPDRTDIAAGMRMAMAMFPEGYVRRMVVLTDGNENVGHMAEEIEAASASQVSVDVIPLRYRYDNEILFDRIIVPSHASRDTKIPVRLIIKSQRPTLARLSLYHNDVEVPVADAILKLTGDMKPDPFTVPLEVHTGGVHRFDARITPLNERSDSIPENNRATAFTFIEDQGRVLILTQAGSNDDRVLYDALKREKIDVEIKGVDQLSIDLLTLQEYSALIVANISADAFTPEQHRALASYVRDFGGGLIMTGGDEALGAGGWIGSAVEEVSPVSFAIPHKAIIHSAAIVFVLDRSGSMGSPVQGSKHTQQEIANEAAILTLKTFLPQDYVGLIAFDASPDWIVELQPNRNAARLARKIRSISPGGGTNIAPGLANACQALKSLELAAGIKHVILLTDGQSQPGPYHDIATAMSEAGITLSTIGIGDAVDDQVLYGLAQLGKGTYHPVKNPRRLPQVFFRETKILRRRLLYDQPFVPRVVPGFSPLTTGFSNTEIPGLGGFVRTSAKEDAVVPIVRPSNDGDDPVLAHWNFEMGKMAVFTSGWWPKWGADWSAWKKFGKLWAQLTRWAMRETGSVDFDITTRLQGNKGRIAIEALNKDVSYLNFLQISGRLLPPSNKRQPLRLTQTGPGMYEATFDVNDQGNYLVFLRYNDGEKKSGMIRTGLSVPYSPEFRELDANTTLLVKAAQQANGRVLAMDPKQDDIFRRDLPKAVARQPIWRWVVMWLLLPLFLLDVASRRLASSVAMSIYVEVAVFVVACGWLHAWSASLWGYLGALVLAEVVGWWIRSESIGPVIQFFTSGVVAAARASHRSAQSLSQLRGVREKVREEFDEAASKAEKPPTIPLEPQTDRRKRFDVGDEAAAQTAGDLTEALGPSAAQPEKKKPASKPDASQEKPVKPSDLTARLRKAKKRAQDEMEDRGKGE